MNCETAQRASTHSQYIRLYSTFSVNILGHFTGYTVRLKFVGKISNQITYYVIALIAKMSYILLYVALIFKVFDHFPMVNSAPNIVFIVADDLGWNDISLHGSPQIPTPNIDAIAKDGVVFDNYYVMPDCSPSRSSFLTGRHAIHTGVFRAYNYRSRNGHLNTSYTLLPQYLKSCCNYSTHIVGKWHLGLSTLSTLPTYRGFDTHLGYWFGMQDHQRHRSYTAYDFHNQLELATQYNNTFSTPIFAEEATKIIENSVHNENPFFLYLAFQDIHW